VGGRYGALDPNGIAVEWDGKGAEMHNGYKTGSFGVKLAKEKPTDPAYKRFVSGTYRHFWDEVTVSGVSIGSGGLNYTISNMNREWPYTYDKGEQFKEEDRCGYNP
jgi:hypothetical protein